MKSIMLSIGATRGAVVEARKTIMEIFRMKKSDEVTLAAFKALSSICEVKGTTVKDCRFGRKVN